MFGDNVQLKTLLGRLRYSHSLTQSRAVDCPLSVVYSKKGKDVARETINISDIVRMVDAALYNVTLK